MWILALVGCASSGPTHAGDDGTRALQAYRAGDFSTAEEACLRLRSRSPEDLLALRLLGRIQLYTNRLADSVQTLRTAVQIMDRQARNDPRRAIELREEWHLACQDLAVACYRMDDYATASEVYALLGEGLLAAKYRALAKDIPYIVRWEDEPSILPFTNRDPVPTVRLRVNGIRGLFAVDTGTGEIVLDPKYAKQVGAKGVGLRTENFSGAVEEAWVDEVTLGTVTTRNVPVRLRRLASLGGEEIHGILGANFLLHFSFTLDYRKERLILRQSSSPTPGLGEGMPLLIVGDRFLVVPGKVDDLATLILLDTGRPKVPVFPSAGLVWTLSKGDPRKYRMGSLSFGPISLSNPAFDSAPFPPGLDTNFGFSIGAAVGHEALRNRVVTFDIAGMKVTVD